MVSRGVFWVMTFEGFVCCFGWGVWVLQEVGVWSWTMVWFF